MLTTKLKNGIKIILRRFRKKAGINFGKKSKEEALEIDYVIIMKKNI